MSASANYLFTFHPTFTQGLVIGQLSILLLLYLTLKYLFLDSTEYPVDSSSYHPVIDNDRAWKRQETSKLRLDPSDFSKQGPESTEWFNAILEQIISIYRSRLCDGILGPEGQEIARRRVEDYANSIRPQGFLDHIKVHSISLGTIAPRLSNARIKQSATSATGTEVDIDYTDDISVSISTSYLFNYPMSSFARLPISLTISLAVFRASAICVPPESGSPAPALSISMSPNFTLNLSTESLMGSRAKLANVPKLHELIQHQVRRILSNRATLGWKIPLPGLVGVAAVKEEVAREMKEEASL